MNYFQPPPLLRLILVGFLVVAFPLIGAIVTAIAQVDQLTRDSGRSLMSVQKNTIRSSLLVDRVTEMERSARQFQALGDNTYRELYNKHRREVLNLLKQLNTDNTDAQLQIKIKNAMQAEINSNNLVNKIDDKVNAVKLEAAFSKLRDGVLEIVRQYKLLTQKKGNEMPRHADRLQRLLISQAMLVIPLSVALAVLFTVLISRPLRQINQGIRSLGHGVLSNPVHVSGTRDLKELGRQLNLLRIRLIELEAQKVQFLRNVSHELKTPLTNIREGSELLLETNEDATDTEKFTITRILRENSIRLQRMIEELLRFGTDGDMEKKNMEETVALHQVVKDTVEKHKLSVSARSVKLHTSATPVEIVANTKYMSIIVDNLLSNAVKYTPTGGEVNIQLKQCSSTVTLDIHDNGPGVSDKEKPHIFEWFFTGRRPPESIIVGTGMGLAIAQEYAQKQNGHISLIDSVSGAHFRLTLRLKNENVA